MKRLKYILTTFIVFLAAFVGYLNLNNSKIDTVLKSRDYSYLPKEAKNYIKNIYNNSGVIIRTEKNKEDNKPYLSPDFVSYISMSKEEKKDIEVIPDVYAIDNIKIKEGATMPSSYDLRNVDGKNFITPLKNQSTLNICWSFAAVEQAESLLLKNSNSSYNSDSDVFSTRQLDYGTSTNGISNYNNEFGSHEVGGAGNFFMASTLLTGGLALTSDSTMSFDTSTSSKSLHNVLNYSNSLYEVNNTVNLPPVENISASLFDAYINLIKQYIVQYGGAYVSTQSPDKSCSSKTSNNTYLIRVDDSCVQNSGHAMQIIGWDDDYSYSYCKTGSSHSSSTSCSGSNLVSGTGAWLVRNSWGNSSNYSYVYLAYDSLDSDMNFTTNISSMSNRTWDNHYRKNVNLDNVYERVNETTTFNKKVSGKEKIEKIKLYVLGSSGNFNLSINAGTTTYSNVKTFTVGYPGYYTVDLSDKNIILDRDNFSVTINSTNSVSFLSDQVSVFTSNVDNNTNIKTLDVHLDNYSGNYYDFYLYSDTKEINSNSTVSYKLFDADGNDVSSNMTYDNNIVARNNINSHIKINKNINNGLYNLKTVYGSNSYNSRVYVGNTFTLDGSGTINDPYLIADVEDLKQINYYLDAHYMLTNDIVLESDWIPIGTLEYPFTGSLNGNNHSIDGLISSLFGVVGGNSGNTTSIKNLYLTDVDIESDTDTGALISKLIGTNSSNVRIDSIYLMDGNVSSRNGNGGALIGSIDGNDNQNSKVSFMINNIFSAFSVSGKESAGLIGKIYGFSSDNNTYKPIINMTNIDVIGNLKYEDMINSDITPVSNSYGAFIGVIKDFANVSISKYVTNSYFYGYSHTNTYNNKGLVGSTNSTNVTTSNGYSIYDNVNLADESLYNWSDFSNYWKKESINGISRMPILKGIDIDYTEVYDITMTKGDEAYVSDFISINYDLSAKLYGYDVSNDNITITNVYDYNSDFSNDIKIVANKYGYSSFVVKNYYDGYISRINITVLPENPVTIKYNINNGNDDFVEDYIEKNDDLTIRDNPFVVDGYRFVEWNTSADGSGTSYQASDVINSVTEQVNLYAIWEPFKYTIKFNANGGIGEMEDQEYYYGDEISLSNNVFTKENYVFVGWNTSADGSGTIYEDGQTMQALSTTQDVTLILYAQWDVEKNYTINYQVDEQNNYIDLVSPHTTLDDYLTHFELGNNYTIQVDLGTKTYIYTGSTTKILFNNSVIAEYTNVVRGDINGDANISALDYVKVKNHIMGTNILSSLLELLAADANNDNNISATDYVRIKNIIMNGGN